MQKARSQALLLRRVTIALLQLCKCMVSGTFNSPNRGTFHLSLALLFHYRSSSSTQPWRMGSPASHGVSRDPCYSGSLAVTEDIRFCIRDFHLLWSSFPADSACDVFVTPYQCPQPRPEGRFGLVRFRSPLLTESLFDFLSYRYLDVSVPCVGFNRPIHSAGDNFV